MNLSELVPQVREHALKEAPRECCGLAVVVKGRLRYWPCKNICPDLNRFEIDPLDYAAADDAGEIVGVCHSHVNLPATPSEADRVICEQTALPWLIVSVPGESYMQFSPTGYISPLVGRRYTHGILDCYQIVVDHFKRELDIQLPHFNRDDNWWLKGEDLYVKNFEAAGFVRLGDGTFTDLKKHDCFLMQMGSPVPNHAAVYLGDGVILQHVYGRLSSRDVYGGYWRKATTYTLRHRSLL